MYYRKMFNKKKVLSFATIIMGASATGIFKEFGDVLTQQSNPCHITCPREYAPVCATDAETYENICLFGIAKCMNKDLQLVANVTCPDLLIHLTYTAQKTMFNGINAIDATYDALTNITKGTTDLISSAIDSIPMITLPNINFPILGVPSTIPNQFFKPIIPKSSLPTSTTTVKTTTTTTATTTAVKTANVISTSEVSQKKGTESTILFTDAPKIDLDKNENKENTKSDEIVPPNEVNSKIDSFSGENSSNSTSTPTTVSTSSNLQKNSKQKNSRKLIEIPNIEDENEFVSQVAKTLQIAVNNNSAIGLNNFDDTKSTVEGMIKTIPYVPGRNNSIFEKISKIIKLPENIDGRNIFRNVTLNDSALPNITDLTNNLNITDKISTNLSESIGNNIPYLRNITSLVDGNKSSNNSNFNIFGNMNTSDIIKNIGTTISNITRY